MSAPDRADDALAVALGAAPPIGAGALLGLEHEFIVRAADGSPLDFRTVIHESGVGRRHLDPADPNAYRLPSGAVVTCDETEAEIAIAPVPGEGPFMGTVTAAAEAARSALARHLPRGAQLEGWSTHLSVSLPDDVARACGQRYTTTFAPALMLLMDRPRSPGLLIRPRPGRLELCGEYVAGPALQGAVAFVAGSVRALAAALGGATSVAVPQLRGRIRLADTRYGWYVDRRAFGDDLYTVGRAARLPLASGGTSSAQAHLERCWSAARDALIRSANVHEDDLVVTDEIVAGRSPLPSEGPIAEQQVPSHAPSSAHGRALRVRMRAAFGVAPVMLTWPAAVFLVADHDRPRRLFAAIPADRLAPFLDALDAGRLDDLLAGSLRQPAGGRRLERPEQTASPGLYDELGARLVLLPPEPGVSAPHDRRRSSWLRRVPSRLIEVAQRVRISVVPAAHPAGGTVDA